MAESRGKKSIFFRGGPNWHIPCRAMTHFMGGVEGFKNHAKYYFLLLVYFILGHFPFFLLFKAWNNHRIIMQNIIFIACCFYNGTFLVLFVIQGLE
jgi:hypothetical protein